MYPFYLSPAGVESALSIPLRASRDSSLKGRLNGLVPLPAAGADRVKRSFDSPTPPLPMENLFDVALESNNPAGGNAPFDPMAYNPRLWEGLPSQTNRYDDTNAWVNPQNNRGAQLTLL